MIQTIKITTAENARGEWKKNFSTPLEGRYTIPGVGMINILTNGKIENRECEGSEITKTFMFGEHNRVMELTYDDETDNRMKNEIKAWRKHPQIWYSGKKEEKTQSFIMTDKVEETKTDVKLLKEKGVVFNLINNAKIKEMTDIAFFVGHNPVKQTPAEIFVSLVDFSKGKLMQDPAKFMRSYGTPDRDYTIITKKAIIFGVFENKEGHYYFKNELIGSDFEDVLAYCKTNTKMFGYVQREVSEKDTLAVGEIEETKELKLKEEKPDDQNDQPEESKAPDTKTSLEDLKKIAKEIGVKNWWTMNEKRLAEKIAEKKAEKAGIKVEGKPPEYKDALADLTNK